MAAQLPGAVKSSSSPEVAVCTHIPVLNGSMATAVLESCHNFLGEMLNKTYQYPGLLF